MTLLERGQYTFRMPIDDLSHVPYRVYTDSDLYGLEQERIFRGPTWNFLALECEIPNVGDYKTTYVGDAPIIVARTADGSIHAMVNRCAHKGALICYKQRGNVKEFSCVYHNWTYDLTGKLTGVAFSRGVGGKGGMPSDSRPDEHGPRRLRVEVFAGLVFGSLGEGAVPVEQYLGPDIAAKVRRVMKAP